MPGIRLLDLPPELAWAKAEVIQAIRRGIVNGVARQIAPDGALEVQLFYPPRPFVPEWFALEKAELLVRDWITDKRVLDTRERVAVGAVQSIVRITGPAGMATAWAFQAVGDLLCTVAHAVRAGGLFGVLAQHLTPNLPPAEVAAASKPLAIVHVSTTLDVAVVRGPWRLPELAIAPNPPRRGEEVFGLGCAYGLGGRVITFAGGLTAYAQVDGVRQRVQIANGLAHEGDSGGPIVDLDGAVRGMISGVLNGSGDSQFVDGAALAEYLSQF